ncbi:MAG TPA: hypothetical protein VFH83_01995 [Spirochaetia bacterium]|nr:hypothetical protein [Spirochaetia bacterium]
MLHAYVDVDGDGVPGTGEPQGYYPDSQDAMPYQNDASDLSIQMVNRVASGSISVLSYSESYTDYRQITNGTVIDSILVIKPAVNGVSVFVTDDTGHYTLLGVPAGSYTITPAYASSAYARTVTVRSGASSSVTVLTPAWTVMVYVVNGAVSSPPLNNPDVRRALSASLDRAQILSSLGWSDCTPGTNLLPPTQSLGTWADGASAVSCSPALADSLLSNVSPFSLTVSVSSTQSALAFFAGAQPFLAQPTAVTAVTSDVATASEIAARCAAGAFQIARFGWGFDSNNLLVFYEAVLGTNGACNYGHYSSTALDDLIAEGRAALAVGDLSGYQDCILELNSKILKDMPIIPLYWIVPDPSPGAGQTPRVIPTVASGAIAIDGSPGDWSGMSPAIADPVGDSGITGIGTDITALYLARDDTYLYWRMDLADGTANPQFAYEIWIGDETQNWASGEHDYEVRLRYDSVGSSWEPVIFQKQGTTWQYIGVDPSFGAFASVCEMKVPLSYLGAYGPDVYIRGHIQRTSGDVDPDFTSYLLFDVGS